MNDEQILLDDLNAFEDFMENADVKEIKKEHGLSSNKDYSFNDDIFNSLSDLLEISKRFADGLYDFKQYLKKEKEKEILKKNEED